MPQEGLWAYMEGAEVVDDCDINEGPVQDDGNFTLADNGDGSFLVTPEDGTAPFACTLSGMSFPCTERFFGESDMGKMGLDALITITGVVDGNFTDAAAMAGFQTLTGACTGNDCSWLEKLVGYTFPCTVSVEFAATAF